MNDGFADAVLYLNPQYRKAIHSVIKEGIEEAYDIKPELNGKASVLISTSLGSKIVFDIINDKNQMNGYNDFIKNLEQIFMTSNQIPLLDLYDNLIIRKKNSLTNLIADNFKCQLPTLTRMNDALSTISINRREGKLPIIAFTDPNDALSYYVEFPKENKVCIDSAKEEYFKSPEIEFINVTISHAKWWWFGKLANPLAAHGGMKSREHGYKSIIQGSEYLEGQFKTYEKKPLILHNDRRY